MADKKYAAVGHVVQVIGPVLDVQFEAGHLPSIFNAVRITSEGYSVPARNLTPTNPRVPNVWSRLPSVLNRATKNPLVATPPTS